MQATYDDAKLILKLYELRREEELRKARAWFGAQFSAASAEEMMKKYTFGSQENTYIRMVIGYWDMACSFVTSGVLNQELFLESAGELLVVWGKIRPVIDDFRKVMRNPKAWSNLEAVGNAAVEHLKSKGPEAYQALQEMMAQVAAASAAKA
ncbi:MAG TPA: hypothetical protein VHW24_03190 [Bryobacteraceae bacterium]|jgi:hypothetical protein|nr:hypothetical protein [Bryobacteraceae bacterium]